MKRRKRKIKFKNSLGKKKIALVFILVIFVYFIVLSLVFIGRMNGHSNFVSVSAPRQSSELEKEIKEMVKGYPMEAMAPYIAKFDRETAAFIVSIAKKESNWGKRTPKMNGEECYNYWGYRGGAVRNQGGFGCFSTPKQAVDVVGARISELANEYNRNTPEEMVVWKCGYSCAGHSAIGVRKWISDVNLYFEKFFE